MFVCRLVCDLIERDDSEKCFMGKLCPAVKVHGGRRFRVLRVGFLAPGISTFGCVLTREPLALLGIFVTIDITFARPFVFWYLKFYVVIQSLSRV